MAVSIGRDNGEVMKISPTIEIIEEGFGDFNKEVVPLLLRSVEEFFHGEGIVSEKRVCVKKSLNGPMCCATIDENRHIILLDTEGNYWCQWVYQFAHEYCHHIIDGGLNGETSGLKWLEESICHVASYVCLDFFERRRVVVDNLYLQGYAQSVILYLRDLLSFEGHQLYDPYLPDLNNPLRKEQVPQEQMRPIYPYIESRSGVLATTYSLEDYKAMAKMLFPHFYNNPKLWRILPNLGDTREWNSLQEVFDHLQKMADDEYNESLVGLKKSMIAG